jgi:hypothetical protein
MAPQLWLISPEDFNTIWNAINDDEPFELTLVTDSSAVLAGQVPNADSRDVIFGHVRHNSTAFAFLSAAWNNNQIGYYCTANGVLICFFSPFGWIFIPKTEYATGRLRNDFPAAYDIGCGIMQNVLNPSADQD